MSDFDNAGDGSVGYRKPPIKGRFQKGQSGNPRGRPKGSHKVLPYESVLGQIVRVRIDGEEKEMTAEQAFLFHKTKKGLSNDSKAARAMLKAIDEARELRFALYPVQPHIEFRFPSLDTGKSLSRVLEPLKMARKLDPYGPSARVQLEPWLVEAALARRGDEPLSVEQQKIVVEATRTPWKVKWPKWWEVKPKRGRA